MRRYDIQYCLKDSAGKVTHPPDSLVVFGPQLRIAVAVPPVLHQSFAAAGRNVPAPREGQALIDSGCTRTSVHQQIVSELEIPPTGLTTLFSASGPARAVLFPVQLLFPTLGGTDVVLPQAVSCNLEGQGLAVLIGRDLLRHFVMIYDGPGGRVTLIN